MKEWVNGEIKDMSPQAEKAYMEQKQAFEVAMAENPDDTARIAELETRASELEAALIGGI